MARRGPVQSPLEHPHPKVDHMVANGRHIEVGTELTIAGERGRFRFKWARLDGDRVVEVTVFQHGYRTFAPERIRTVHRVAKIRPAS